jgi:membrane associated rhomboid family serine protease
VSEQPEATLPVETCYRHADRKAGVRCQRCERPICPSCMVQASVGFQCPECVKGSGTRVIRAGQLISRPIVTQVVIAVNLAVYVIELTTGGSIGRSGRDLIQDYGLRAAPIFFDDEWWRLVTSGFLHVSLIHVGFNMVILYRLGQMLEPQLGRLRFTALYFAGLLWGSVGALMLSPDTTSVGASGAVFGLMAAAVVGDRRHGINPFRSDVGLLLMLNLVFTFAIPRISIGGHLGGLFGGALAGWMLFDLAERTKSKLVGLAGCIGVLAAALPAAYLVVEAWGGG